MTETEISLQEGSLTDLEKNIAHLAPHLTQHSEAGWVLQWGNGTPKGFELLCRKTTALQVERIDTLVSAAYDQALVQLK